jgi:hypothetical protein
MLPFWVQEMELPMSPPEILTRRKMNFPSKTENQRRTNRNQTLNLYYIAEDFAKILGVDVGYVYNQARRRFHAQVNGPYSISNPKTPLQAVRIAAI